MTLRLILIRHGLSTFNVERRIQGRDDLSTLTDEGRGQARRAGQALEGLSVEALWASPLKRAAETARSVAASLAGIEEGITWSDDLLEVDLGPWSGSTAADLQENHPEAWATWRRDPSVLQLERADGTPYFPLQELMAQAERALAALVARHPARGADRTVVVVAHNMILKVMLLAMLGRDLSSLRSLRLDNASISVVNVAALAGPDSGAAPAAALRFCERHSVQLESVNGTTHLGDGWLERPPEGLRLLLVRHGETDWNREGRFQGQIDIPLNDRGREQADAARSCLEGVSLQRAWSSRMSRPRETAEIILRNHPAVHLSLTDGLREIGHGLWEGRLEEEIRADWPDLLDAWKRAPETVTMPEGETIQQVSDRAVACWREIVAALVPGETVLVVAHDAVNKTILCELLGMTPAAIWSIKQGNGGVSVIDYPQGSEGVGVVTALNITAHLGGVLDRTAAGAL
ncbi:histidine phosphatase family protein [Synechococcus sp. RSCCF101]|uniref:histidine phosphatase family protein n=1 Tax=Synechococcus sp. RSCCF101 TaxID=2511069 RepID=UPI001CD9B395|nr:histidine phosphatase family protein [Synechococcus sp. RSCCF101]